jgi:hypothetical protein
MSPDRPQNHGAVPLTPPGLVVLHVGRVAKRADVLLKPLGVDVFQLGLRSDRMGQSTPLSSGPAMS